MSDHGLLYARNAFIVFSLLCLSNLIAAAQQVKILKKAGISLQLKVSLTGGAKFDYFLFSFDGKVLATKSKGTIQLWNSDTGKLEKSLSVTETNIWWKERMDFFQSHKIMFPQTLNGDLEKAVAGGAVKLAVSHDRQMMLTSKRANKNSSYAALSLWDITTGQLLKDFKNIDIDIYSGIYWSPNIKEVVVVGHGRTKTKLIDIFTGNIKAELPYKGCSPEQFFGDNGCQAYNFNADGSIFLTEKAPIALWSSAAGELLAEIKSPRPAVFSPVDKELLATFGNDKKTVLLWRVVTK